MCVCVRVCVAEFLTGTLAVIGLFGSLLSVHLLGQACPLRPVKTLVLQAYTHTNTRACRFTAVVQLLL